VTSYESHAAGEDHKNDERLEVFMLDQLVHDEAPAAPDLSRQRSSKRVHPRTLVDAVLRTAVVWILHNITTNQQINLRNSAVTCFTENSL